MEENTRLGGRIRMIRAPKARVILVRDRGDSHRTVSGWVSGWLVVKWLAVSGHGPTSDERRPTVCVRNGSETQNAAHRCIAPRSTIAIRRIVWSRCPIARTRTLAPSVRRKVRAMGVWVEEEHHIGAKERHGQSDRQRQRTDDRAKGKREARKMEGKWKGERGVG